MRHSYPYRLGEGVYPSRLVPLPGRYSLILSFVPPSGERVVLRRSLSTTLRASARSTTALSSIPLGIAACALLAPE